MKRCVFLVIVILLSIPSNLIADDNPEEIFSNLAIGEEKPEERQRSKIDRLIEDAESFERTGEWEEAIKCVDKVLKDEPTHNRALMIKNNAKRKKFWSDHGDHFILFCILVVVVPSAWRIMERLRGKR